MKKTIALLLVLTFVLGLSACNFVINEADETIATIVPTSTEEPLSVTDKFEDFSFYSNTHLAPSYKYSNFDIELFPTASDDYAEMLAIYADDVKARLDNLSTDDDGVCFTNNAECELIDFSTDGVFEFNLDQTILNSHILDTTGNGMYYPIVYKDVLNAVWVYYTDHNGELRRSVLLMGDDSPNGYVYNEYLGNVHTDAPLADIVSITQNYAVVYNDESHVLSIYVRGSLECEHNLLEMGLSENTKYVGHCLSEGYLFQDGTDLYALPDAGTSILYCDWDFHQLHHIASDVQMVVEPNYTVYARGIYWYYVPLLLMTDNGGLATYHSNYGNGELLVFEGSPCYTDPNY